MSSDQKYKDFRNFMVNELGITRQDIEAWTKQAVASEIKKLVGYMTVESQITGMIQKSITNNQHHVFKMIAESAAEDLVKRLKVVDTTPPSTDWENRYELD